MLSSALEQGANEAQDGDDSVERRGAFRREGTERSRRVNRQWNTNWRPGYRTEAATASNGWANHIRESLTHTMDFSWNFRKNADFFVNARNVPNQDGGTYRGRSDLRTRWVETGAIWATGVRATF